MGSNNKFFSGKEPCLHHCLRNKGYSAPDGVSCCPCIVGVYKTVNGSGQCLACAPGFYSEVEASLSCVVNASRSPLFLPCLSLLRFSFLFLFVLALGRRLALIRAPIAPPLAARKMEASCENFRTSCERGQASS